MQLARPRLIGSCMRPSAANIDPVTSGKPPTRIGTDKSGHRGILACKVMIAHVLIDLMANFTSVKGATVSIGQPLTADLTGREGHTCPEGLTGAAAIPCASMIRRQSGENANGSIDSATALPMGMGPRTIDSIVVPRSPPFIVGLPMG